MSLSRMILRFLIINNPGRVNILLGPSAVIALKNIFVREAGDSMVWMVAQK